MKTTVTLDAAADLDGGQKVDVTLKLMNGSDVSANEEFNQTVTLTVPKGEKTAEAVFTVSQAGEYKCFAGGKSNAGAVTISANTQYDAYWKQGVVETNGTADVDGTFWYDYDGSPIDLKVTKLTGYDYKEIDPANYQTVWYKDTQTGDPAYVNGSFNVAKAEKLASAPTEAGTYYLTVWPAGDLEKGFFSPVSQPIVKTVKIDAAAENVEYSFYEKGNAYDVSDKTFVFNGSDYLKATAGKVDAVGIAVDGKALDLYTDDSAVTDAGTYYVIDGTSAKNAKIYNLAVKKVVLDGKGTSIAQAFANAPVAAYVDLTIEKFDFSKATVAFDDIDNASDNGTAKASSATFSYDGTTMKATFGTDGYVSSLSCGDTDLDSSTIVSSKLISLNVSEFKPAANSNAGAGYKGYFGYLGEYSVSLKASDVASDGSFVSATNFAFSGEPVATTVRVAKNLANDFVYDRDTQSAVNIDTNDNGLVTIDTTKNQSFDPKLISWSAGSVQKYNGSNAVVKIYKDGEEVSAASTPGNYKVVVSVTPDREYGYAGTCSFDLKVIGKSTAAVLTTVENKIVADKSTTSVSYDGEPVDWSVVVRDTEAEKVLTPGTDYKVEVRNVDENKVVDSIVDPGEYVITVSSGEYEIQGGPLTFTVKVNASVFEGFEVVEQTFGYDATEYDVDSDIAQDKGIAYTGETVAPTVKAYVTNAAGKKVYTELDPAVYELTYTDSKGNKVAASDLKKVGEYTATISLTKAAADANVKDVTIKTDAFEIVDTIKGGFTDVKASEWYADEATKAKQLGYMKGLSGTDMLLPNANITRADVAIVLFRMAGGQDDPANSTATYPTKFSDVAEDAYYAKAIDWAYKAGVVSGYDGTDSFGPNDLVTREQLATMLGRFAENVQGKDVAEGEIDGYVDSAAVSDFAKEGMSYCVDNGIFGVNTDVLDPQGFATRAQVAAISVRVMPAEEL